MRGLLESGSEMLDEREAIAIHDGGLSLADAREQARSDTAAWLHRSEVRYVCAKGAGAGAYLALVEQRRGKDAAEQLRADAREQYRRGNRGQWGDWRW